MAELADGEKSWEKTLKARTGFYTLRSIWHFLGVSGAEEMKAHLKACGIVLGPFIRDEPYKYKVYKRQFRHLTEAEARKLIERVRSLR